MCFSMKTVESCGALLTVGSSKCRSILLAVDLLMMVYDSSPLIYAALRVGLV